MVKAIDFFFLVHVTQINYHPSRVAIAWHSRIPSIEIRKRPASCEGCVSQKPSLKISFTELIWSSTCALNCDTVAIKTEND